MNLFGRALNQKLKLNADAPEQQAELSDDGITFSPQQHATILAALKLNPGSTTDEVVAAVTALAEQLDQTTEDVENEIAASAAQPAIHIDHHVWRDMQRSLKRGLTLDQQEHRLAAEQTVDQAIRLGKASPGDRERWIAAYERDPETTVHSLNRGKEIPRIEIGYSMDIDPETAEPKGWVR